MKDILQDIVKHTHSLGFIDLVKIVGEDTKTEMDAMAAVSYTHLTLPTKRIV